ncbi:MAG: hypothetical protein HY000_20370 [Planctomycetes bacterium]|nr:hypothetical protein [Planctomycetota bacterium]
MHCQAKPSTAADSLHFRQLYRDEMDCQVVHDSIHGRPGWTKSYLLEIAGVDVGFGTIAIGGPWKDKPTLFEFYVVPEHRTRAFDLFDSLLAASRARLMEIQSNDPLLSVMLHTYCRDIAAESIVFHDKVTCSATIRFPL